MKKLSEMKSTEERISYMLRNPWMIQHEPFEIVKDVYFVGTSWVSMFLINTEEGLILIDCAMQETLYQLIDSIYKLGFKPENIKKLLVTHGHFDHCGAARAIQELSGCEIWMPKDDAFFFDERRDLINFEWTVPEFEITNYYDYDNPIKLGSFEIEAVHTPGHTPGTTSLFFDSELNGQKVHCAIYGGLGSGVLQTDLLIKTRQPFSLRDDYCKSIDMVLDRDIDVVIPSHAGHYPGKNFLERTSEERLDKTVWREMLLTKKQEMLDIIANDKNN